MMPPQPSINRPFHDPSGLLHHIEFYVSDLQASAEFYDWFLSELGYLRFNQWEDGQSWKRRDTYIVLQQAAPGDSIDHAGGSRAGMTHLAFHARSRRQVDDILRELRRRGTALLDENHVVHAASSAPYAIFFTDPDGIKLELVAPD